MEGLAAAPVAAGMLIAIAKAGSSRSAERRPAVTTGAVTS
jgi:hypothetical protein